MLPLVAIGFLCAGLLWTGLLMWRFPAWTGMCIFGVVIFLDCINLWSEGVEVGIFIHPDDVACAAVICAAAILFARHRMLFSGYLCKPALVLLALAVLNFFRGTLLYGGKPAGNGIRSLIYLIVPFLAISVISRVGNLDFPRATVLLCGASFAFTAVAVLRWLGLLAMPEAVYEDFRQISRVLAADYPMLIGQALIALIGLQLSRGVRIWPMAATLLFSAMVLVSQHRSVWLATAAGLSWLAYRSLRAASPKQILQFWKVAICAAVVIGSVVFASGQVDLLKSMLKSNVEETKKDDSTLAWRINGYDEALERAFSGGVLELVLGPPAGRDLDDVASKASVHIHNRYIDTGVYYGIFGLVLLLSWFWILSVRVWRRDRSTGRRRANTGPGLPLEALLLSQFVYFMAYAGNMVSGAMLGMLWAACIAAPQLDSRFGEALRVDLFVRNHATFLEAK